MGPGLERSYPFGEDVRYTNESKDILNKDLSTNSNGGVDEL